MNENVSEINATEVTERDNLAVVGIVERMEDIPNKDRIALCHIKDCGYTFITEKIHSAGDPVVYVKYDSIVPDNELFAFMKETKFRVKAKSFTERDEDDVVIKKIYSQGIVLSIQKVIDFLLAQNTTQYEQLAENAGALEGQDVTEILGVKKYIPPVSNGGGGMGVMASKGDFPTYLCSKTDETSLASKIKALEEIQGMQVVITQKIEGSSLTCLWDEERDELMVCSRNNQIGYHETNKFWQAVKKRNVEEICKNNRDLIFQGELYGESIQKNHLAIKGVDFAVFNIVRKSSRELIAYDEMICIANKLQIPLVETIKKIESFDWSFNDLQEFADIQKYQSGYPAEGIVIRPKNSFYSNYLKGPWSSKVINRNYSL